LYFFADFIDDIFEVFLNGGFEIFDFSEVVVNINKLQAEFEDLFGAGSDAGASVLQAQEEVVFHVFENVFAEIFVELGFVFVKELENFRSNIRVFGFQELRDVHDDGLESDFFDPLVEKVVDVVSKNLHLVGEVRDEIQRDWFGELFEICVEGVDEFPQQRNYQSNDAFVSVGQLRFENVDDWVESVGQDFHVRVFEDFFDFFGRFFFFGPFSAFQVFLDVRVYFFAHVDGLEQFESG
jgi:hypothetical protein